MRVRRTHSRVLIALPAVAALALSACGDDEDATTDTTAPVAVTATATATQESGTESGTASVTAPAETGAVTVADAWSRQPAEGQTVTAVYAVVSNASDADVTIVAASSPVSSDVQLHETIMEGDQMTMKEKEGGFVVPAGGDFAFESGGPHIMMMGIDPATYPAMVEVTLELDSGESLTFEAEVRSVDGTDTGHDGDESGTDMGGSGDHQSAEVDSDALHDIDEQLAAGTIDAAAQRAVVAEAIAALTVEGDPATGTPEANLLGILRALDEALADDDLAAAAEAAAAAHDAAHDLDPGHG
jgi:copper(I)-binding protein